MHHAIKGESASSPQCHEIIKGFNLRAGLFSPPVLRNRTLYVALTIERRVKVNQIHAFIVEKRHAVPLGCFRSRAGSSGQ